MASQRSPHTDAAREGHELTAYAYHEETYVALDDVSCGVWVTSAVAGAGIKTALKRNVCDRWVEQI